MAEAEADASYGYGGYGLGYAGYGGLGYAGYGGYGLGYGHGYGYGHGLGYGHYIGKRDAEAAPEAVADASHLYGGKHDCSISTKEFPTKFYQLYII